MSLAEPNTRDIFLDALAFRDLSKRMAWVTLACGENSELCESVMRLLRHHDSLSDFMSLPVPEMPELLCELSLPAEEPLRPGDTVDRYLLGEIVGSGGMGTVFRAQQLKPMERVVALKVLRSGTMSPATVLRFEQERQSLAQMNHPGIVSVLDAGRLDDGRPYFAMDFVDGKPVTEFCQEHDLPVQQRIRLVINLCEAVQHAHYRGIIHQDLKPANVLTTWIDGQAVCRLIDFGIRRDLFGSSESQTGLVAGTPSYMSPEQISRSSAPPDTRSDVYALGGVLSELLFGSPHAVDSADSHNPVDGRLEIGSEETLSAESPGTARRSLSPLLTSSRRNTAAALSAASSQELTAIIQKARQPNPSDRYSSAAELSEDLRRFLSGKIVKAVPSSAAYRVRKFAGRNRIPLFFAGTALLSLVAGLMVSLYQTRAARIAEKKVNEYLKESRILERRYQALAWESTIKQAYGAWEDRDLPNAQELLAKLDTPDSNAGQLAEWGLLHSQMQSLFLSHRICEAAITDIRRLPSRNLIAVACGDGSLRLLDADTTRVVRELETGIPSLHALAVNTEESLVAVGGSTDRVSDLSTVRIYDLDSSVWIEGFPPQLTTIETLEFSRDSQLILCGARYENPQVFRISDRSIVRTVPANRRNRWGVISPTGRMAAVEQSAKSLRLLDMSSPEHDQIIETTMLQTGAFWLPKNGRLYCVFEHSASLILYDVEQQQMIARLEGTERVSSVTPSIDGISLLAATDRGDILVWELPSELISSQPDAAQKPAVSEHPSDDVLHLPAVAAKWQWTVSRFPLHSVSDSETSVFAGNQNGEIVRVRKQSLSFEKVLVSGRSGIMRPQHAEWHNSGNSLLLGSDQGEVLRVDWRGEKPVSNETGFPEACTVTPLLPDDQIKGPLLGLCVSKDLTRVASWNHETDLIVSRDLRTGKEVRIAGLNPTREISSREKIAYSPAGDRLAWTVGRNVLVSSANQSQSDVSQVELPGLVYGIEWVDDGKSLLIGGQFDGLFRWSGADGNARPLSAALNQASCLQTSEDGSLVLAGHFDGSVRIWKQSAGEYQPVAFSRIHHAEVLGICLLNQDRVAVSVDRHLELTVWLPHTGQKIGVLGKLRSSGDQQPLRADFTQLAVQGDDDGLILSMIEPEMPLLFYTWPIGKSLKASVP